MSKIVQQHKDLSLKHFAQAINKEFISHILQFLQSSFVVCTTVHNCCHRLTQTLFYFFNIFTKAMPLPDYEAIWNVNVFICYISCQTSSTSALSAIS